VERSPERGAGLMASRFFSLTSEGAVSLLRLQAEDGTNRLTAECVLALAEAIGYLAGDARPLVITGNGRFFSAGAELAEIATLTGPAAYEFAKRGQTLMRLVEEFPAPVYAAISGYCMGGGFDLALACHRRIASPHAVFGHRGAALGLMTGWGGTQRLPRIVGKGIALELFVAAEKVSARRALQTGIVDAVVDDPVAEALARVKLVRVGVS
jgi:enoyl-CoA hydratase